MSRDRWIYSLLFLTTDAIVFLSLLIVLRVRREVIPQPLEELSDPAPLSPSSRDIVSSSFNRDADTRRPIRRAPPSLLIENPPTLRRRIKAPKASFNPLLHKDRRDHEGAVPFLFVSLFVRLLACVFLCLLIFFLLLMCADSDEEDEISLVPSAQVHLINHPSPFSLADRFVFSPFMGETLRLLTAVHHSSSGDK